MYGPGFTPQTPRPAADDAPPVQTVSTVEWFFAILLMAIPLVNLIFRLSCNSWGIKFSQFPSCIYLC